MNIPRVPQLPQQFICEAPAFAINYIQEVMAWGNMGWDKVQEKETRVAELEEENAILKMQHEADAAAIGQMARKLTKA